VEYRRLILCFPTAELIFDPYSGSGTTATAALIESRSYLGCEVSKKYFEASIKRIEAENKILSSQLKIIS
jgi:DNA modification methylase